jgi:hypothetical protein
MKQQSEVSLTKFSFVTSNVKLHIFHHFLISKLIWRKVGGGDSDCAFVKKKFPGEKKV